MLDESSLALWDHYWHPIAHRSEVANPRDFVRMDVAGQEVVAFNDGQDVIVFDNLCPHRGARIFDGNAGNARFTCRYHGWSYANGKLFIANKADFDEAALKAACLPRFETEWVGDFLFASKSPRGALATQLAGLEETLTLLSRSCAARADYNAYVYQCDWRIAVENALEPYHIGSIHPDSLNKLRLSEGVNSYFGENSVWASAVGDEKLARKLSRIGTMFDLQFQYPGYWSVFLFPFSMISSTFGFSYSLQHFFPDVEQNRSNFVSRLFTGRLKPSASAEALSAFFDSTATVNRQVFEEDHDICQRIPRHSWSSQPPRIAARSEAKLVHFRQSYRTMETSLVSDSR